MGGAGSVITGDPGPGRIGTRMPCVVADSQPLFRAGTRIAATASGRLEVVGEPGDIESLLACVGASDARIAIVGTALRPAPGALPATGLGAMLAVRRRHPDVAIVVVADRPCEAELFDAMRFGAMAYVGRAMEVEEFADVLRQVASGAYVFGTSVLAGHAASVAPPEEAADTNTAARDDPEEVTARELEVLDLIGRGRSNRAIGEALQIGDQTVKTHVTSILRKLGVSDRTCAVVEAMRRGLMRP